MRPKKLYMAMEDNEVSSSTDSDNKEKTNLTLMVSHHFDNNDKEVSEFEINNKPSYDELQNVFLELYAKCLTLSRICTKQTKIIVSRK